MKKLLFLLFITSCTTVKVPFTSTIQKSYTINELKQVQYYIAEEVILFNASINDSSSIQNHTIVLNKKQEYKTIRIKKNTKCVLDTVINNKFLFSFEDNKTLIFGNNKDGYCTLLARDWKNGVGRINYGKDIFTITNGHIYLKVKIKQLNNISSKTRTVKGKKL
jgi:hypothetical protein